MNAVQILMIAVYIIVLLSLVLFLARQQLRFREERQNLVQRLEESERLRARVEEQIQAVMQVNQKFSDAANEAEIIETMLSLSMNLIRAMGASFVPLDERGQPKASFRRGDFPFPFPGAWLEYLASTAVRQNCQHCNVLDSHGHTCALLKSPFSEGMGLYCFPLRYGAHDLGMLNLYLPESSKLEAESRVVLQSLVDASVLALEGERLRQRELATFSHLRATRQRNELSSFLVNILESLCQSIEAEVGVLSLASSDSLTPSDGRHQDQSTEQRQFTCGEITDQELEELSGLFVQTIQTSKTFLLSNDQLPATLRAGIAVPLLSATRKPYGVFFMGSRKLESYHQRQLSMVQIVSEQVSFLIQNANQMAGKEYQVIMEERTRLAREIHDGLAQTLSYLKLQMAQMFGYLERGEQERLARIMRINYETLASAYQDVREAIDGLRIRVNGERQDSLESWLRQIVAGFAEEAGSKSFQVSISDFQVQASFPPEIHAQLIRIIQEALSNIRKHARAQRVWISCVQDDMDLILEIRDDGQGFSPEDVPGPSMHGLQGMRERAELIGADFQVISRPGEGTVARIQLPIKERYRLEV